MVQDVEKRNKSYNQYVENVTKKAGCVYNCFKAFITGGIICTIGQLIMNFMKMTGMTADDAASYTTLILVALSVIFTGFGIYPLITSFGGAGALVPITGFANSIASPAIEYKKEGQVFGIGCFFQLTIHFFLDRTDTLFRIFKPLSIGCMKLYIVFF